VTARAGDDSRLQRRAVLAAEALTIRVVVPPWCIDVIARCSVGCGLLELDVDNWVELDAVEGDAGLAVNTVEEPHARHGDRHVHLLELMRRRDETGVELGSGIDHRPTGRSVSIIERFNRTLLDEWA
jgi:hypothetical protein